MKVAVSIPDAVFAEAEKLSRMMGTSRSKLYARALDTYVATHMPDRVTESWNKVLDDVGAQNEPVVRAAARQVLRHTDW